VQNKKHVTKEEDTTGSEEGFSGVGKAYTMTSHCFNSQHYGCESKGGEIRWARGRSRGSGPQCLMKRRQSYVYEGILVYTSLISLLWGPKSV